MKKTGKALGVLTALSMAVTAVFPGTALADLTEEQSGQISTVIVLAENDIQGNEAAIRILLEQCHGSYLLGFPGWPFISLCRICCADQG